MRIVNIKCRLTLVILVFTIALAGCVSSESNLVTVPDVRGKGIELAEEELFKLGLKAELEEGKYYASIPSGYIVTQSPYPFTKVKPGRKIKLIVSKGIAKIVVPDVNGLQFSEGREKLLKNNLKIGSVTEVDGSSSYGIITSQDPPAGTEVSAETYVNLSVAISKPPSVPNLIDVHFDDAKKIITESGYVIGRVIFKESSFHPRGVVIQQEPIPNSRAELGSPINLVVNEKEKP